MSLMAKLKKNSTIKEAAVLSESKFFNAKDVIQIDVPALNIAYSGSLDGGLVPGLTQWAAGSRHFKSMFSLISAKAYLDKYDDAVLLFYDSEFGTPKSYFQSLGIDMTRVLHTPLINIEQMKFDVMGQLTELERGDHVVIIIDSIGNISSLKEMQDALDQKSVADMSRAKQLKSFFRMVTPHLSMKDIPMIVVNHVYQTQCLDGDTKIKTKNGNMKISEIKVGDEVFSLNGLQKVLNVYTPLELDGKDKDFYEMEFDDGSIVRCTHDHKFLMKDGEWKEANEIKLGESFY